MGKAHVIVFGNEKGGSGKSTTAMHVVTALLKSGLRVAAVDLDGRQKSLARYIENRAAFMAKNGLSLGLPTVEVLQDGTEADDKATFKALFEQLSSTHDAIVIDCPGRDSFLSREAHAHADTLITPLNDSFVDLDLLATVDPDTNKVIRPSFYSELVWKCRQMRAGRDRGHIDWVVLRTRLSHLDARNMRKVGAALDELSKRIGFRVLPGLSERVIYREMFLKGLTLLDLREAGAASGAMNMSQIAARQELRDLVNALNIPALKEPAADQADSRGETEKVTS
jgi:chromosome partitioning protein